MSFPSDDFMTGRRLQGKSWKRAIQAGSEARGSRTSKRKKLRECEQFGRRFVTELRGMYRDDFYVFSGPKQAQEKPSRCYTRTNTKVIMNAV
jgi:hypothetical protein